MLSLVRPGGNQREIWDSKQTGCNTTMNNFTMLEPCMSEFEFYLLITRSDIPFLIHLTCP